MYEIKSYTANNSFKSNKFDSAWAVNMIAISYIRNYPELNKVEIINLKTGEIEKVYKRG